MLTANFAPRNLLGVNTPFQATLEELGKNLVEQFNENGIKHDRAMPFPTAGETARFTLLGFCSNLPPLNPQRIANPSTPMGKTGLFDDTGLR